MSSILKHYTRDNKIRFVLLWEVTVTIYSNASISWKKWFIYDFKLYKCPLLQILNYKKEQMKIKSLFALSKENLKSTRNLWKYAIYLITQVF